MIEPIYYGQTAAIIGTGPSLTQEQLDKVKHLKKFGANRAFEFDLDVLHGCNHQFWHYYWHKVKDLRCDKWTTRPELTYPGLNYIREEWIPGLSKDPTYIAAHHGTGPQLINIAYHYGIKRMLLIGWDMKFSPDYNGKAQQIGAKPRHYFGEYPKELQHWPSVKVKDGVLTGLIEEMETIKPEDYGIEIINCTPDSAMTCFPMMTLDEALIGYS